MNKITKYFKSVFEVFDIREYGSDHVFYTEYIPHDKLTVYALCIQDNSGPLHLRADRPWE